MGENAMFPQSFHSANNPSNIVIGGWRDVEAALVEAMRTWLWFERRPRAFATDGPWREMRLLPSERYGHVPEPDDVRALERAVFNPTPDRDMIGRAERVTAWLLWVDERDRRLVMIAVRHMAAHGGRVPWLRIKRDMGVTWGAAGLARRYERALTRIARRLGA